MRKFFSNRKLVIVILCLIVCLGLITLSVNVRNRRSTPPLIQQFGNDVVGFTNRVVTIPTNGVHRGVDSIGSLLNTYQENQKLKKRVNGVVSTQVRNQALQNENKRLKQQLHLGHSLTDYKSVNASIMTRTPSNWQNQIIINKGESSGIKKNMPVIVASGLVGRVAEVNKTNSKVELVTDNSSSANRFAIQIHNTHGKDINGIITGYNRMTNRIKMGNITTKGKLKKGDRVSTNGLGGIMPKGLYIGKVTKVTSDDYGLSKEVSIKPAANLNDIEVVTVVGKDE